MGSGPVHLTPPLDHGPDKIPNHRGAGLGWGMVMGEEWASAARNYHDLAFEFFVKAIVSTNVGDRENYQRAAQFYAANAGAALTRAKQALDSAPGYGAEGERGNQRAEADARIARLEGSRGSSVERCGRRRLAPFTSATADAVKIADVARV